MPSATTIRGICTDSLMELGVLAQGEAMTAETGDFMRRKLERLLNNWNAERCAVYATTFTSFTLSPSVSPHTIGPSAATFTVTQRPVSIDGISLALPGAAPTVYVELTARDEAWYRAQTVPDLSTDIPTDFFYEASWPNGEIYFWPVPDAAYDVRLTTRVVLDDAIALTDSFSLPPGYQDAITLTLAEESAVSFGTKAVEAANLLAAHAQKARARIFANNDSTPTLATRDHGMPGRYAGIRSNWNYLIGADNP